MAQYGFHVNIQNCIACRACEGACNQENRLPVGVQRRRVIKQDGLVSGVQKKRYISMACNHCANPACVAACPVGYLYKESVTGLVLMRPSTAVDPIGGVDCIGCRRCGAACPYGAPQYDPVTGLVDKCTGCYHRLADGGLDPSTTLPVERQIPACVVTCTSHALSFDVLNDITDAKYGQAKLTTEPPSADFKDISDPSYTDPSIRFATSRYIPA